MTVVCMTQMDDSTNAVSQLTPERKVGVGKERRHLFLNMPANNLFRRNPLEFFFPLITEILLKVDFREYTKSKGAKRTFLEDIVWQCLVKSYPRDRNQVLV